MPEKFKKSAEKPDPNQVEMNFSDEKLEKEKMIQKLIEKKVEKIVEKDSKSRTREDVIKIIEKSGFKITEDKDFPGCIVFKNGEYYVFRMLADDWISYNKKVFGPKKEKEKKEEDMPDRLKRRAESRQKYLRGEY